MFSYIHVQNSAVSLFHKCSYRKNKSNICAVRSDLTFSFSSLRKDFNRFYRSVIFKLLQLTKLITIIMCHTGRHWWSCFSTDLAPWYFPLAQLLIIRCATMLDVSWFSSLSLPLHLSPFIFPTVMMFSSLPPLCPVNDDRSFFNGCN